VACTLTRRVRIGGHGEEYQGAFGATPEPVCHAATYRASYHKATSSDEREVLLPKISTESRTAFRVRDR
jgi:hypothetical protein